MEANYAGYPVYKGLQMPLEFMGIRGRFILIAAATFGAAFLGFIAGYVLFGLGIALLVLGVSAGGGLLTIYLKQRNGLHTKQKEKQRNGLHTKQKEKGIKHYHHLYEH